MIRNSKLRSQWVAVDRSVFAIGERSANSMVRSQGVGDLYREYLGAHKYGIDFNLMYIPEDFGNQAHSLEGREYMRALYQLGYDMALKGGNWKKVPPGLETRRKQ